MKIHVISGGTSSEREVSLRSGKAVSAALRHAGYKVAEYDTTDPLEKITDCDVVFPVLHGEGGEDGTFQTRLEQAAASFVGSGSVASRLCMDKSAYRTSMTAAGYLMPGGFIMNAEQYGLSLLAHEPHVIKPVSGGSSVDTIIIRDPHLTPETEEQIKDCFSRHDRMIVEKLINGTEITVGVLGDEALPAIEIIPPEGGEFDYENKYNGATAELLPPKHISGEIEAEAKEFALRVHRSAGCRDMSRSDFIVGHDDRIYLLETNTIPGMTDQSLYPKMAAAIGLSMAKLCDHLVRMAGKR